MEHDHGGTGQEKSVMDLFAGNGTARFVIDKDTTRSYKKTFLAVILLRALRPRPPAVSSKPRIVRFVQGTAVLGTFYYWGVHLDPALIDQIFFLK
jgi:hypothetical protein